MDELRKRVRASLTILGKKYEILCNKDEEAELLVLGEKLEGKLKEMRERVSSSSGREEGMVQEMSAERLAVVYALNLMRKIERFKRYLQSSEERVAEILYLIDAADTDEDTHS